MEVSYDRYYWQNDLVRLRAMRPEDWQTHYPNRFDSWGRMVLECGIELPPTEQADQEEAEMFSRFKPESGRLMFVAENLEGEAVGALNLNSIDERNGSFSIGIQINRDCRGRGYGTAAMRLVLNYAFCERRLNKFNTACLDVNEASQAMMKKLGCVREGVRRECVYAGGRYHDEILLGVTAKEFLAIPENIHQGWSEV